MYNLMKITFSKIFYTVNVQVPRMPVVEVRLKSIFSLNYSIFCIFEVTLKEVNS